MGQVYNIYCDESCHLEHDDSKVMVIGGIWCSKNKIKYISDKIKDLKIKHGIKPNFEVKWVKVSPNKIEFYSDMIKLFLKETDLHFRCLIVSDKTKLRHFDFNQDHNTFYDKMYYLMLCNIIDTSNSYNIYIDIKDTHTNEKSKILAKYLRNKYYDYNCNIIQKIQPVNSSEIQLMQLVDILIGAVSYINRDLKSSEAKLRITKELKEQSGLALNHSTSFFSKKINIFVWDPS
ncbi:DUF3800 domain-containing protein [Thermoanaerobacterium sp. R66]|uniref:DUF3800 domain-containing protein n=1 Tax=Thermoanaerobacterium sp. R66 TaxID=2742479 RepID=UPI0023805570|nr:DUF3800 domain-containing protein [Thermoanaerobacterium sp. R66]MDE4542249.1 DUF3800 domain-containing protein [Thermoanaerobacterium sp. R66]